MNPYVASAIAALVPMVVGFLWYNPKTFEPTWMETIGMTKELLASYCWGDGSCCGCFVLASSTISKFSHAKVIWLMGAYTIFW